MSILSPRIAATLVSVTACAAQSTIGAVDFFAYAGVDIDEMRTGLAVRSRDRWTADTSQLVESSIRELLGRNPSDVVSVCCDEYGNRLVYIGLAEGSGSRVQLNPQPTDARELDRDLLNIYERFDEAVRQATTRGEGLVREDHSRGFPLSHEPDVRALQQRIREYALSHPAELFKVSRTSSFVRHRAVAIDAIGYGQHTAGQVEALTHGALDPDAVVRNNAIRALAVLASSKVEPKVPIPHGAFVDLLASDTWHDRNKSLALLSKLTEARDSNVLAAISQRSLGPLVECARWSWSGHAYWARVILGRIGGIDEAAVLEKAWSPAFVDFALGEIHRSEARQRKPNSAEDR